MTRRKNGFWNFCFSFIPGAGEMYQGFYKQGASLMVAFWGIIALSWILNLGFLACALPVIWFYSFFHTHNLASLSDEEFYAAEDVFLFGIGDDHMKSVFSNGRGKKTIAVALIVLGAATLWKNLQSLLYWSFCDYFPGFADRLGNVMDRVPQLLIAVFIIALGVYMIRSKKQELDRTEKESKNGEQ